MHEKLEESFKTVSAEVNLDERYVFVGIFKIWIVLVVPGGGQLGVVPDKFVASTCDTYDLTEKPSEAIIANTLPGPSRDSFDFLGQAKDAKQALKRLVDYGYFQRD